MSKKLLCVPLVTALLAPAFAGDKKEYASAWPAQAVTIDGAAPEWENAFTYLEKEEFAYAVKNDSNALYVCLKFDRELRRPAMMFGFTIWLDPNGKSKRELGIRYPIGMQYHDTKGMTMPHDTPSENREAARQQRVAVMLHELDILESDRSLRNRLSAANAEGVQAAADSTAEMTLEFKIPLHSTFDQPYAVEAGPGQTISLGLEMGELDRDRMRDRMMAGGGHPMGGGMPPGGMSPGGGSGHPHGGMGGGMHGGRPPGSEDMPKPFKVWFQVTLASPVSQK